MKGERLLLTQYATCGHPLPRSAVTLTFWKRIAYRGGLAADVYVIEWTTPNALQEEEENE